MGPVFRVVNRTQSHACKGIASRLLGYRFSSANVWDSGRDSKTYAINSWSRCPVALAVCRVSVQGRLFGPITDNVLLINTICMLMT
jgi:hypothetical protein